MKNLFFKAQNAVMLAFYQEGSTFEEKLLKVTRNHNTTYYAALTLYKKQYTEALC